MRVVRNRAMEDATPSTARVVRSRAEPAAVRVSRSPFPVEDEAEDLSTEPEVACYMVRTRLTGKHPDWFDMYKILNTILKKAQEELGRRAPEASVYFELVYWAEEDVTKYQGARKFEKVK